MHVQQKYSSTVVIQAYTNDDYGFFLSRFEDAQSDETRVVEHTCMCLHE